MPASFSQQLILIKLCDYIMNIIGCTVIIWSTNIHILYLWGVILSNGVGIISTTSVHFEGATSVVSEMLISQIKRVLKSSVS